MKTYIEKQLKFVKDDLSQKIDKSESLLLQL